MKKVIQQFIFLSLSLFVGASLFAQTLKDQGEVTLVARLLSASCNQQLGIAEVELAIYNRVSQSIEIANYNLVSERLCAANSAGRPSQLADLSMASIIDGKTLFTVVINADRIVTSLDAGGESPELNKFNLLKLNEYRRLNNSYIAQIFPTGKIDKALAERVIQFGK